MRLKKKKLKFHNFCIYRSTVPARGNENRQAQSSCHHHCRCRGNCHRPGGGGGCHLCLQEEVGHFGKCDISCTQKTATWPITCLLFSNCTCKCPNGLIPEGRPSKSPTNVYFEERQSAASSTLSFLCPVQSRQAYCPNPSVISTLN